MASVRGRVGLLLAAANAAAAISGDFGSTETAGITPAEVAAFLKPELTFVPDKFRADSAAAAAEAVGAWQAVARTLTGLQKLDCGHDAGVDGRVTFKERELLNATEAMLDVSCRAPAALLPPVLSLCSSLKAAQAHAEEKISDMVMSAKSFLLCPPPLRANNLLPPTSRLALTPPAPPHYVPPGCRRRRRPRHVRSRPPLLTRRRLLT
jgi:hypothetical protein